MPSSARPSAWAILWFPLTLVALLLLAIPGAILLALNLLGREGIVNGWLQQNLGLSYHLAVPWWASLLILFAPLLILLLYFLKMKRRPLQVPSTFLWRKSIEDLQVNSLFQWLRDNVLLLIQLLIALLLIYSVLSFQVHGQNTTGKHYILLIDSSASMSATDVAPSRLEAAQQEALQEIDRHGDGDSGMVIEFNSRAAILQPYTTDRNLLRSAVRRIKKTNRPTRIAEAFSLAESLANPLRSTEDAAVKPANEDPSKARTYVTADGIAADVHLFSDGGFSDADRFAAGNLDLKYHRIGKPGPEAVDNVGIVAFNANRHPKDPTRLKVFAHVLNFRNKPIDVKLDLEWRLQGQDDFKLKDQTLHLEARRFTPADPEKNEPDMDVPGSAEANFELPDIDEGATLVLHARLNGVHDAYPLDDEAWLVVGVVRKARVLIVTEGNEILSNFFDQAATAKVANVSYLKPADLADEGKYRRPAREGAFDLVIFDRCAPDNEEALPLGHTFFIDDVPPPWKRKDQPPLKGVQIRNPSSTHPLMRHLTALDEIAFTSAFRFELSPDKDPRVPPRVPRLLETDRETAVLFALPRRSFTDLVLAFPLANSKGEWYTTWNLKLSFPVFLRNVLYGLGNVSDAAAEEALAPGEVKSIRPDVAVAEVEVFDAGGKPVERISRSAQGDFLFQKTDGPGVYWARWDGGQRGFAVGLLDRAESNLQPRDSIQVGSQRLAAGTSQGQPYDTWKWVAVLALLLLVLEWVFYHRRVFG